MRIKQINDAPFANGFIGGRQPLIHHQHPTMQNDLLLQQLQSLRTELFQTEILLQQAQPDAEHWPAAIYQAQRVLQQCAAFAAKAATHLYPLAEPYEPSVVDALRRQQETIGAAHLAAAIATFPTSANPNKADAAQKLKDSFDVIVLSHMQYLLRIQTALLPILQRYYTQDVLDQVFNTNKNEPATATTKQQRESNFRKLIHSGVNELAAASANTGEIEQPVFF